MEDKLRQSWLALAVMMAVAVVVLAPDVALAQQEGAEVIQAGAEWIIGLFKQGAVILLVLGFIAVVGSLIAGSVAGAAIGFFALVVGGAILMGADAAVARWFGGGGVGI